ncbi:hypothetical protein ACQP2T_37090 [Nonomuraea sp. CA-143628]|uniref:hypothetical protein n=1 Tax=Nonomuraea sp. CA-143628 TaxID=3239997 RepID=UPI003D8F9CE6
MTAEPPRAYSLVTEGDGLTYIYNAGARESRYGIRPYSSISAQALETLVEMLNNNGETRKPYLAHEAFKMLLRVW